MKEFARKLGRLHAYWFRTPESYAFGNHRQFAHQQKGLF